MEHLFQFQDILEAHKATYSKDDVVSLSPISINNVKLAGLPEACKREKEPRSEPNFAEAESRVKHVSFLYHTIMTFEGP